ncbi:hypothetical protein AWJ20_2043 [Sugiyamaella lignohabitans]|uniref:RlpA-like protein double-psi beta-barrel domain-containing protein n=1 Tax=Sugiyamaella lignohabitans TaxID=796027 RepID=A0A167EU11_9ASCO|nr:uncharacterized protein AWJ20_2043 [Sugiyamaella lignohabitans]ANB14453.1 hypothetical protein AWJ20_2043 [Sugiyamaella lignohabitans]
MRFSYATSALLAVAATSVNAALVTQYVQVTVDVYEQAHVFVNGNGDPVSTSYELVSSEESAPTQVPSSHQHSDAQPVQIQLTTSTAAASSSPAPPPPAPTTSSSTTTPPPPPPPTTTSSPPPPPPAPSSSSASSDSSDSSSSSGSGEFSGQGTFYSPGMGSCGIESSDSDFIAALNAPQMGSPANPNANPNCGKKAIVYSGGKSVTVTIVDKCPSCAYGSLDLSPAAFNELADPSAGRIDISWSWAS